MAETGAAVVDEAAAVTDPGDRGSLRVRDRAIEHLVEAAVLTTPGVRRHGKALSNLVGHDLPRVDAVVAGDHVRTAVEVADALQADVVILAVPFEAVRDLVARVTDWEGRIVVDADGEQVVAAAGDVTHLRPE